MTSEQDEAYLAGWRAAVQTLRDRLNEADDWAGISSELDNLEFAAAVAEDAGSIEVAAGIDEDSQPGSCPTSPTGLHHFVRIGQRMRCDSCGHRLRPS